VIAGVLGLFSILVHSAELLVQQTLVILGGLFQFDFLTVITDQEIRTVFISTWIKVFSVGKKIKLARKPNFKAE